MNLKSKSFIKNRFNEKEKWKLRCGYVRRSVCDKRFGLLEF